MRSEEDEKDGFVTVKSKKNAKKGKTYHCKGGPGKPCGRAIGKKDSSIQCDGCEEWVHPGCQGISNEAFKAISLHSLFWVCHICKKKFTDNLSLGKVVERVEQAEKKIIEKITGERDNSVVGKELEEKINNMEMKVEEKLSEQKQVIIQSSDTIKKAMKDSKEEREMNLIIHNIPESDALEPEVRKESDMFQFQEMSRALCGEDTQVEVEKIFRLGKKEGATKPRLLLVRLKNPTQLDTLYRRRFKLSEVGHKNRYITRDLTPEERNRQRELRGELRAKGKETHRIFRNKVVPREQ